MKVSQCMQIDLASNYKLKHWKYPVPFPDNQETTVEKYDRFLWPKSRRRSTFISSVDIIVTLLKNSL